MKALKAYNAVGTLYKSFNLEHYGTALCYGGFQKGWNKFESKLSNPACQLGKILFLQFSLLA